MLNKVADKKKFYIYVTYLQTMRLTNENRNKKQTEAGGLVMKTNFKTNRKQISETIAKLFIVAAIIIASASVNGQNFWTSNNRNIYNIVSQSSLDYSYSSEASFNSSNSGWSALMKKEAEPSLELESWMTEEKTFGTFITVETETDSPLELENWMTDESYFNSNIKYEAESDAELQLENWMTDDKHFQVTTEQEKPLQLESWMVKANFCSR